ncbi:hypothetical protein [Candidatus Alkanophaga liquidiphilum]
MMLVIFRLQGGNQGGVGMSRFLLHTDSIRAFEQCGQRRRAELDGVLKLAARGKPSKSCCPPTLLRRRRRRS